jgi:hypothetical protein
VPFSPVEASARAGQPGPHFRFAGFGAPESARQFAGLLAAKDIQHELDLWGHDVPRDWPSWRAQVARHLPRFC